MVDVIEQHFEEIRALCLQYGVARLGLFGSAAKGQLRSDSDLDFVVSFRPMSPQEHLESFFGLMFGLEEATGRAADLLELDAIENPYLLAEVQASQRDLYAA